MPSWYVQMCRKDLVMTHFGAWNFKMDDNGKVIQEPAPSFGGLINYKSFIDELNNIDYDGYLISEYCVPLLKNHQMDGIDEIDKANAMALNFIKELVNNTTSVLS